MKIVLSNFCCWENKVLEFPDTGSILLSAPSGYGKTSIVRAIMFALFGVGQKVVKHGKKNCCVELIYLNLHIKRTKGPCRLLVWLCTTDATKQLYEDDVAQNIILDNIHETSLFYLDQKNHNSFVDMVPTAKLSYLESIAFQTAHVSDIKDKLKARLKTYETTLVALQQQEEIYTQCMKDIVVPPEVVLSTTLKQRVDPMDDEIAIQHHQEHLQQHQYQLQQTIQQAKQQRALFETSRVERATWTEMMRQYQSELDVLPNHTELMATRTYIQSKLDKRIEYDKYNQLVQEFNHHKQTYEQFMVKESNQLDDELHKLEKQLKTFEPISSLEQQICEYQDTLYQYKEIALLYDKLSKWTIDSNALQQCQEQLDIDTCTLQQLEQALVSYSCPSCNATVLLKDNNLILVDMLDEDCNQVQTHSEIQEDIERCTKRIAFNQRRQTTLLHQQHQYDMWMNDIQIRFKSMPTNHCSTMEQVQECMDNIQHQLTILHQTIHHHQQLNTKYQQLTTQKEQLESRFQSLFEQMQSLHSIITKTTTDWSDIEQIDQPTWTHQLAQLEQQIQQYTYLCAQYTHYETKLMNQVILAPNLVVSDEQLNMYEQELLQLSTDIQILYAYQQYITKVQARIQKEQQLLHVNEAIQQCQSELTACMIFKKRIAEAEAITMANIIDTLNVNVQLYIDAFFLDDPMSVYIVTEKEPMNKKKSDTKYQINIDIEYKGVYLNTLSTLSGGEYDRLVLAFTLAFADMNTSKLLILDECISSLDQVSATTVFQCIRHHCADKLVLVIAHQIITGIFDETIDLTEEQPINKPINKSL